MSSEYSYHTIGTNNCAIDHLNNHPRSSYLYTSIGGATHGWTRTKSINKCCCQVSDHQSKNSTNLNGFFDFLPPLILYFDNLPLYIVIDLVPLFTLYFDFLPFVTWAPHIMTKIPMLPDWPGTAHPLPLAVRPISSSRAFGRHIARDPQILWTLIFRPHHPI